MFSHLNKIKVNKSSLRQVPTGSGVYFFLEKSSPIYIGKAVNLRARLQSYFASSLIEKTARMVNSAELICFIEVPSETEALLLEANLIKQYQPHFNSALKDDKHPLYIGISNERYPRVLMLRKAELDQPLRIYFGPFPSGQVAARVLRYLRRVFPFSTHKIGKRRCMDSHIQLCLPCPNEIEKLESAHQRAIQRNIYLANVRNVEKILSGKIDLVKKKLARQMTAYARDELFEEADIIKRQVKWLEYMTQPTVPVDKFVENPNLIEDLRKQEVDALMLLLTKHIGVNNIRRIESFDVAHLAGSKPTASMVTFVEATADKKLYRHFRIRKGSGADDLASMREVAARRVQRLEDWGRPDLIVVDGGRTQVRVFNEVFAKHKIPVVGLAKRSETLIIPKKDGHTITYIQESPKDSALYLLQRIRNEAHRFARCYHHKLVRNYLITG